MHACDGRNRNPSQPTDTICNYNNYRQRHNHTKVQPANDRWSQHHIYMKSRHTPEGASQHELQPQHSPDAAIKPDDTTTEAT